MLGKIIAPSFCTGRGTGNEIYGFTRQGHMKFTKEDLSRSFLDQQSCIDCHLLLVLMLKVLFSSGLLAASYGCQSSRCANL